MVNACLVSFNVTSVSLCALVVRDILVAPKERFTFAPVANQRSSSVLTGRLIHGHEQFRAANLSLTAGDFSLLTNYDPTRSNVKLLLAGPVRLVR